MITRSEFRHQLEEIDETLGRFSEKTAKDIRALALALAGDADTIDEVLGGAKSERRLRTAI